MEQPGLICGCSRARWPAPRRVDERASTSEPTFPGLHLDSSVVPDEYSHDVFISHASEDKDRFVRPLAEALNAREVTVWYDEWELRVGESLVDRINEGLSRSEFGVVVLSPAFFTKNWSRAELQAFASLEMQQSRNLLLPVWLDVGTDEIASHAPLLLGRVALRAEDGVDSVAQRLAARINETRSAPRDDSPDAARALYPGTVQNRALPNTYCSPLDPDDKGFVVRTAAVFTIDLPPDAHLTSQQKRAFQAICSDSSVERMMGAFVGKRPGATSPAWAQALPNLGTVATVARAPEALAITGGTVKVRSGLSLQLFAMDAAHAVVHVDVVFKAPEQMRARSVLSLDDLWTLLKVPAASVRQEIAPVVGAVLSGNDEPSLVAQSVVATAYRDDFSTYLDLSAYATDRVAEATGPSGVHWTATTTAEVDSPEAWTRTVIKMIDRLFSDGSFLDYEDSLLRLETSDPPGTMGSPTTAQQHR
jgi:hypothetical protein